MEISGYKVEIIGGKHGCALNDSTRTVTPLQERSGYPWPFSSPWLSTNSFGSANSGSLFGSTLGSSSLGPSTDNSYVEMKDGDHYSISLKNNHSTRCYAKIFIDGNSVGTWVLEPWQRTSIERPVDIAKKFTFLKVNSAGGAAANLVKGDSKNGLIVVEFTPEIPKKIFNCCGDRDIFEEDLDFDDFSCKEQCLSYNKPLNLSRSLGNQNSRRGGQSAQFRRGNDFYSNSQNSFCDSTDRCVTKSLKTQFEEGGTGLQGKSDQNFGVYKDRLELDHNSKVTINLRLICRKESVDYDRITPLGNRSNAIPPSIF
jgi:hypothetical protein